MKMRDVVMLAWKNAKVFSKQSLKIILVMGVVFGVILGVELWFQGVKNTYEEFASKPTDGKVIMIVSTDAESVGVNLGQKISVEEMLRDVRKYGEVVGEVETAGLLYDGAVLDEDLVEGLIEVSLEEVPDGAVPILVSTRLGEQLSGYSYSDRAVRTPEQKLRAYEEYRARVLGKTFKYGDAEYFVVGLRPGGFHTVSLAMTNVDKDKTSLVDVILEQITAGTGGGNIVVRNGSIWEQHTEVVKDKYVVVFENAERACEFYKKGRGGFVGADTEGKGYVVEMVAGMSPEVKGMLKILQVVINIICVILAMVAIVIVTFASIGLIDSNRENIRLYYNVGATQKQVKMVYWWYFLWLMLGVVVASVLMAVIGVVLYNWANQEALRVLFATAFSLVSLPRIMLIGMNYEIAGFVGLIILMTFVGVWVNRGRLQYNETKD